MQIHVILNGNTLEKAFVNKQLAEEYIKGKIMGHSIKTIDLDVTVDIKRARIIN